MFWLNIRIRYLKFIYWFVICFDWVWRIRYFKIIDFYRCYKPCKWFSFLLLSLQLSFLFGVLRHGSNVDIVWFNRQHKKLFRKFLWLQMKNLKLQRLQQRRQIHHGVTLQSQNASVFCWSSRSLFTEIWLALDTIWHKFYF
jgi:hypothetical protein